MNSNPYRTPAKSQFYPDEDCDVHKITLTIKIDDPDRREIVFTLFGGLLDETDGKGIHYVFVAKQAFEKWRAEACRGLVKVSDSEYVPLNRVVSVRFVEESHVISRRR